MTKKFASFDAADYLDEAETIAEYISAALDDPNPDVFLTAVRDVAHTNGVRLFAKDWDAIQETLYLLSVPGMRDSIEKGRAEPLGASTGTLEW